MRRLARVLGGPMCSTPRTSTTIVEVVAEELGSSLRCGVATLFTE
jgi:hypothetical protein